LCSAAFLKEGNHFLVFILKIETNKQHIKLVVRKSKSRERDIFLSNEIIVRSVSTPESGLLFYENMKALVAVVVLFDVVITSFFFLEDTIYPAFSVACGCKVL
jgi:hypothetical protein